MLHPALRFCFWSQTVAILVKGWSHARHPHPPVETVWWFDLTFLSLTLFSSGFWNVRWATKSQGAQSKVATSLKYKMATSIYSGVWRFLCEGDNSVHQHSVVLKTGCRCFSSRLMTAIRSLLLLSLVTDALMVRERCWLLEGEATQYKSSSK